MSLITEGTDTGRSCAIARWHKGGAGGGGAREGETSSSGVGSVRVPEGSSQGSLKGSSTRSSSGTTVTRNLSLSIIAIIVISPIIAIKIMTT